MTVWAQEGQVALDGVVGVTIDVFNVDRHAPSDRVAFAPPTLGTPFAELLPEVATNMIRGLKTATRTAVASLFTSLPTLNVRPVLRLHLALVRAERGSNVLDDLAAYRTRQAFFPCPSHVIGEL